MNVTSFSSSSSALIAAYSSAANSKVGDSQDGSDQAAGKTQNGDSVSFSGTATDYSAAIASNAPYFPVRAGMNADALILGVASPGRFPVPRTRPSPTLRSMRANAWTRSTR